MTLVGSGHIPLPSGHPLITTTYYYTPTHLRSPYIPCTPASLATCLGGQGMLQRFGSSVFQVRVWHALFPWGWIVSKYFVKSSKGPTCKTCADSRSCTGWSKKSSELHCGNVPLCFNRNLLSPGNEAVWMLLAVNNIYTALNNKYALNPNSCEYNILYM